MSFQYKSASPATVAFPILDAQAITLFQPVKLSGGNVVPVTAAADVLLGLAGEQKAASDGKVKLSVYLPSDRAIFEASLDSAATVAVGDILKFDTSATLTPAASGTNGTFEVVEPGTSVSTVRCRMLTETRAAQLRLTDSTTGSTAITALAAGVGIHNLAFPLNLASVTASDVVALFTPGHKFKILAASFVVNVPVTTAARAATLTPKIGATLVTGGAVALTSANCTPMGATVAGSSVTAGNTGTSSDTVSVTASSVTAFAEGSGTLFLRIQNMDTADAVAAINAANRV